MPPVETALQWTPWQRLEGCWRGALVPRLPGLYRIRRAGQELFDYIGQTGEGTMTLRRRLGMFAGLFQAEMPYRAPHTAAPALWALRHREGCAFEVSVAVVEGSNPWRKGMEAAAIALYRQQWGRSPTVSFGRMPEGYRMSSNNSARLESRGKRFRGGPSPEVDDSHAPGIAPVGPLSGEVQAPGWCGHSWSEWAPLPRAIRALESDANGLYRIRGEGQGRLLYLGQGRLAARLAAHLGKAGRDSAQGALFGRTALECSWVATPGLHSHQRLELENDLIGAHVLELGEVPAAQFLGK